nr:cytochrome C oxidase subunit IV family protein [Deltaproteobacteria bacterium]
MSTATSEHTSDHAHADDHDNGEVHAHVSSPLFMIAIFSALIFLTVITVAVSYVDLGAANTLVAMIIATAKASLVATFFMHLKGDKAIHTIILLGAVLFLGIFLGLSNDDLSTRTRVDIDNGARVLERTGVAAPVACLSTPRPAPAGAAPAAGAAGHH